MSAVGTPIEAYEIPGIARPGDVVAFQGRGFISGAIRLWTWSRISHVGVMYDADTIVESTQMDGSSGVRRVGIVDLAKRYMADGGRLSILPLSEHNRRRLSTLGMQSFLDLAHGRPYDYWQVARLVTPLFRQTESDSSLFCSELVAMAHNAGQLYRVNASEMSPADITRLKIYQPYYYQLKPTLLEIPRFNTVPVVRYRRRFV